MAVASKLRAGLIVGLAVSCFQTTPPGFGAGPAEKPSGKVDSTPEARDFFESRVRPILADSCFKCHGPAKQSSGLRLDSREAMLTGGDNGPALVPGDAAASMIVRALSYEHDEIKMPPKGKLGDPAVAAIRQWVKAGAYWPETGGPTVQPADTSSRPHWAFQPVRRPTPPAASDPAWISTPIDAFILAKLDADGLTPSPRADRRTLLRRLSFDLIGLPPTAEQVEAFEADDRPDAYARVVDRLLASPEYGERWGRHWLDVARYADTKGYVFTAERRYPFSYTYRDYVVGAFNRDLPFDRFIVQQIAADRLPLGDDPRPLAAMGFLTVGRRFLNDRHEIIDDRIDVVTRGLLGLTVSCARCHDHKFDPIPTADYYALYGVFANSVEPDMLPALLPAGDSRLAEEAAHADRVRAAVARREAYLADRRRDALDDFQSRLSKYFQAAWELDFNPRHPSLATLAADRALDPNHLRALASSLRRGLNLVTRDRERESVLQVWRSYSGLKPDEFAAKSAGLAAGFAGRGIHPLLARALAAKPPAGMADVVARFTELFDGVESRLRQAKAKGTATLADAEWESFRQAIFGPNGLAGLAADSDRFLLTRSQKEQLARFDEAIEAVKRSAPPAVPRGMVMNDAPKIAEPHIFKRGNPNRHGEQVPRRFLKVLSGPDRKPFTDGSGRLELARAIVDPANPLTARVLVNRVWAWHFGSGLVDSASDFGRRSDPPSHPELLDWLADELIRSGWSMKALHRLIVLSSTYRQRSELRPDCRDRDPRNRRLWRYNRRRLDFEAMRDAVLAAAGTIDLRPGGASVMIDEPPFPTRRTLYGFIDRQNLDPVYRTFDFAVPNATTPKRFVTTVPQQALFLMNSPFLQQQARRLAAEVDREAGGDAASSDPADRVRRLYRRVLGRSPADHEIEAAARFLDRQSHPAAGSDPAMLRPGEQLAQVLLLTNEFMFID
jgi:hypothetical protein